MQRRGYQWKSGLLWKPHITGLNNLEGISGSPDVLKHVLQTDYLICAGPSPDWVKRIAYKQSLNRVVSGFVHTLRLIPVPWGAVMDEGTIRVQVCRKLFLVAEDPQGGIPAIADVN